MQALVPCRVAGGHVKHETQGLGSSSGAVDGDVVTQGGGTSTGNMTGSTESCPHGCEGNTETRPLIYRDSLRQGQAEQM